MQSMVMSRLTLPVGIGALRNNSGSLINQYSNPILNYNIVFVRTMTKLDHT